MKKILVLLCCVTAAACHSNKPKSDNTALIKAAQELKTAVANYDSVKAAPYIDPKTLEAYNFDMKTVVGAIHEFFRTLKIEELQTADSISKSRVANENHCLATWSIFRQGDSVIFEFRMDKNPNYQPSQADSEDDVDLSSLCEHQTWYNFRMVNGKMKLTSILAAD